MKKWRILYVIAGVAATTGLLMLAPHLNNLKSRASRPEVDRCAWNLSTIGVAILRHARENGDAMPASLEDLVIKGFLTPDQLVCPSSNDSPTRQQDLTNTRKEAGHNSYLYLGAGKRLRDVSSEPIAFDRSPWHERYNVLYGNGDVDSWNADRAEEYLRRTRSSPSTRNNETGETGRR